MIPLILSALFGALPDWLTSYGFREEFTLDSQDGFFFGFVTATGLLGAFHLYRRHVYKERIRELTEALSFKRNAERFDYTAQDIEDAYDRGARDANCLSFNPPRRDLVATLAAQQPEPEATGIGSRI